MLMFLIYLVGILSILYYMMARRFPPRSSHNDEPPMIPGAAPIIGHVRLLLGDSFSLWHKVQHIATQINYLGGVCSAYVGPREFYVVTDPDDIHTISNACLKKDQFMDMGKCWLGNGLFTAPLQIWKTHRKQLQPAFSPVVVDSFLPFFNSQSRKLVKTMEKEIGKPEFDQWDYLKTNLLESICMTALGVDFRDETLLNKQYVWAIENMLYVLAYRFQNVWFHNEFLFKFSKVKKIQDECLKILHGMSNKVLEIRKAQMLSNMTKDVKENIATTNKDRKLKLKPFMDLILELSLNHGVFNDQEIREEVDTIIVGGHETSATVMTYILMLMGVYPEVQEKVYEELLEVFEGTDRDVDKEDLKKLVYLEAVIKESMRYYPISPVLFRWLDKDVKLKNCTLSARRTCLLFIYGTSRHPIWGEDREDFKPERWLNPATLPDSPHAFNGFMVGMRACIGKTYVMNSMKTTLSHLLRSFKFHADGSKLKLKFEIMLKPHSGYYVSIERREKPEFTKTA